MIWNEILCLGDSITFGARDPYKRSYPNELGQILSEKVPDDVYEDNLRQIISIAKIHGMHVIVGTLPELAFTPLYLNRSYIKRYNDIIYKLSKKMNFDVCDLSGVEAHYVDGVHFTHEGNVELANRFTDKILKL